MAPANRDNHQEAPDIEKGLSRRRFLFKTLAGTCFGVFGLWRFCRTGFAMGTTPPRQGVYRFKGDVTINGHPVAAGSPVLPGDAIATGPDGELTFIKGQSAFLVQGNTRIVILHETPHDLKGEVVVVLKILKGKVLSVLGKGRTRIETSTVVAGVRGTAIYVASELDMTYICTCYGDVEIRVKDALEIAREVKTHHHEQPFYVYGPDAFKKYGHTERIVAAPMTGHTDTDLIFLESLVGRVPPFVKHEYNPNGNASDISYY